MIVAKNKEGSDKIFNQILDGARKLIVTNFNDSALKKSITPETFEQYVCEQMQITAEKTEFEGLIERTPTAAFPDIVANGYFGVEVKMTSGDKWETIGNSVLESSRIDGIEKIYMFFGKFGGNFDIAYRNYPDCLFDVAVTHYPRYKINMKLANGESIFNKIKIDYNTFRKDPNSIKKIKEYYRAQLKEGEELWWIDQTDVSSNPIIRPFSKFGEDEKTKFIIESMIFFPEIFGSSSLKFERVASYLVTNYGAVSSNIRDTFTAGGQQDIKVGRRSITVPKILFHLKEYAPQIKTAIKSVDSSKLAYYWRIDEIKTNKLKQWLELIDTSNDFKDCSASIIFDSGL